MTNTSFFPPPPGPRAQSRSPAPLPQPSHPLPPVPPPRPRGFLGSLWDRFWALRRDHPLRWWVLVISWLFSTITLALTWYMDWDRWPRLVFVYAFSLLNLWFYFDVAAMVRTFDRTRPFVVAFLVALSKGERLCQLFFILRAILLVNLVLNVSLVSALTLDLVVWIALFLSSSVYRDLGIFPEFLAVWPPVMVQAGRASAGLLLLGVLGYGAKTYADHLRDVEQHRMQKDLEQTKQANKEALARQRHQDALEQDNNRHRNAMELEEAKRKPVSAQPQPQGPVPPPGLGSRSPWWAPTSGPKNPFKP